LVSAANLIGFPDKSVLAAQIVRDSLGNPLPFGSTAWIGWTEAQVISRS
jgi:hypothetical protein